MTAQAQSEPNRSENPLGWADSDEEVPVVEVELEGVVEAVYSVDRSLVSGSDNLIVVDLVCPRSDHGLDREDDSNQVRVRVWYEDPGTEEDFYGNVFVADTTEIGDRVRYAGTRWPAQPDAQGLMRPVVAAQDIDEPNSEPDAVAPAGYYRERSVTMARRWLPRIDLPMDLAAYVPRLPPEPDPEEECPDPDFPTASEYHLPLSL